MGRVRNLRYDAVIGIGGLGAEPRSFGIDGKLNWVGIGPRRGPSHTDGRRAAIIEFDYFVLLEADGPSFRRIAPQLAQKMYGGPRYILDAYSSSERSEALAIIAWALGVATAADASSPPVQSCRRDAACRKAKLGARKNLPKLLIGLKAKRCS